MAGNKNKRCRGVMWPVLTAMCIRCSHDKAPAPTVSTKTPPNTTHWMMWQQPPFQSGQPGHLGRAMGARRRVLGRLRPPATC
jgi:hypothetical protein